MAEYAAPLLLGLLLLTTGCATYTEVVIEDPSWPNYSYTGSLALEVVSAPGTWSGQAVTIDMRLQSHGSADRYRTLTSQTHRIRIYDVYGYEVWDSTLVQADGPGSWLIPAGGWLNLRSTWGMTNHFGYPVQPGTYTVTAQWLGSLDSGTALPQLPVGTVTVSPVNAG